MEFQHKSKSNKVQSGGWEARYGYYVSYVYLGYIDTKEIQDIWETHEDQIDTCKLMETV